MNATDVNGRLIPLRNCYLKIGSVNIDGENPIYFNNLPDLGDSKGASYENTNGIGRAAPSPAYANSEARNIPLTITLVVQQKSDCKKNLRILRRIQSATYPRTGNGAPYYPPTICQVKCGSLLSEKPLCCILKDYNVKFPQDVPWDEETMCPYKMEVSMTLEVVYASRDLPNNDMILKDVPV